MRTTPHPMTAGRFLALAAAVLLAVLVLAAAVSGGGDTGFGDGGYGEQSGGSSQPGTQFYQDGSITDDGNGGLIVSGTDGTSFSTDG